jgi:hypothetical protein
MHPAKWILKRRCAALRRTSMSLINHFIETGIIQFGRFQQPDGSFWPVQTSFRLLPSYPAAMKATAQAFRIQNVDRLLATRDATALGAVVSVESGIPLTYEYGEATSYTSAFVIEGAFDVGHPTALITNIPSPNLSEMLVPARKNGLDVKEILCILDMGLVDLPNILPLFTFEGMLSELVAQEIITRHHEANLLTWFHGK